MESSERQHDAHAVRDYLRILWQRKWIVLIPLVLVPLAAVFFSLRQERLYQASAQVVVRNQSSVQSVLGIALPYQDPARFLETEVNIARTPDVAQQVVDATGLDMTPGGLLGESSVTASSDSDLLTFTVTDPRPARAARLATAYADAYTKARIRSNTLAIRQALQDVNEQIAKIGQPNRNSVDFDQYTALLASQQRLQLLAGSQAQNIQVVRTASGAAQVQPRPVRNGALGLGLGLFFGIGLAFLWHALDTRIRSAETVGEALGLPLLGRLPTPSRRVRRSGKVSMLADPSGVQAEAFRVLRTNLEFVMLANDARSIMITSGVEEEGKSTTAVNLAVAFARAGKRVTLLDLDLRRPSIDRMLGLEDRPGITDVALGHATLEEAITPIALAGTSAESVEGNGGDSSLLDGVLEVVTSGPTPPNPGEFISWRRLTDLLGQLRDRADLLLVDTAPILRVGDPIALSRRVDGVVLLVRLNVVRRGMLGELRRNLEASPSAKLGFVVTGADAEEGYEYRRYYRARGVRRGDRERVY